MPLVVFLEKVIGLNDAPESHEFPLIHTDFAEKRDDDAVADRVMHRAVEDVHLLIAAPSGAVIKDRVGGFAFEIRIAGIYFSEVSQQRHQDAAALINPVA